MSRYELQASLKNGQNPSYKFKLQLCYPSRTEWIGLLQSGDEVARSTFTGFVSSCRWLQQARPFCLAQVALQLKDTAFLWCDFYARMYREGHICTIINKV